MPKIELDVPNDLVLQLRAHADAVRAGELDAQARYDALSEGERGSLVRPEIGRVEDAWTSALRHGAADLLAEGQYPNMVIGINATCDWQPNEKPLWPTGCIVALPTTLLPIGCEVLALVASIEEGSDFEVVDLRFGMMNLVSPHGGPVSLSSLCHLTRRDLLSEFNGKKTKVDINVNITLRCVKPGGARFSGYTLFAHQEEVSDSIATRVEAVDVSDPMAFPQDRARFEYTVVLAPDTSSTDVANVLACLRAVLECQPRVWPEAVALVRTHAHGLDVEVRARVQALTAEAYAETREALLLKTMGVLEVAQVRGTLHSGRHPHVRGYYGGAWGSLEPGLALMLK